MILMRLLNKKVAVMAAWVVGVSVLLIAAFLFLRDHDTVVTQGGATFLSYLKDFLNALFFLVVGSLAILSYLQARKTLFTPIKTEVFKFQLKVFEELLLFFQNQSESDFIRSFDLEKTVTLNSSLLMDEYVSRFFKKDVKIDSEKHKERYKEFVGGMASKKFAEKYFVSVDYETELPDKREKDKDTDNPTVILAQWNDFDYGYIQYRDSSILS